MSVQQSFQRAAVTVTEMAAMCDLSRSRFYTLVESGVFPAPVQNESRKRPAYVQDLIEKCLEIRRTGVGLDGRIVLFNRKHTSRMVPRRSRHETVPTAKHESPNADLLMGLKSLGMVDVTDRQVEPIVRELFPEGRNGHDLGELIRAVFLRLKQG